MIDLSDSLSLSMLLYSLVAFLLIALLFVQYLSTRIDATGSTPTVSPSNSSVLALSDRALPIGYTSFSRGVAAVSSLAWLCDWPIQLPLLLSLLASQGYGQADRFILTCVFIASSFGFGLFFGALADRYGR
jgi:hypothetical protein